MAPSERERRLTDRAEADRRYNDALTTVDRALPAQGVEVPLPGEVDLGAASVREGAAILPPAPPGGRGWRGRLAAFLWRTVGPVFTRQQAMNEAVAAHAGRTEAALVELIRALREQRVADRRHVEAMRTFESRLVQYLQQITPFIDTKLRVLQDSVEDLRMTATSAQRAAVAARRHAERPGAEAADREVSSAERGDSSPALVSGATAAAADVSYVGFEDLFRGTPDEIRARQAEDADRFAGASNVLDVGCGRGEFLDLLRDRGVTARGIDRNAEMIQVCRARGLVASQADGLEYLDEQPDGSLGGLVAAQVVEHLEPAYLVRFLEAAHAKLRPGATIVLETINVACWVAFFESYVRDITHVRPLHPDTLKFLVVAAGFEQAAVHFRSPIDVSGRLQPIALEGLPDPLRDVAAAMNANVDRLNERLFTYLDYAVIAVRGR